MSPFLGADLARRFCLVLAKSHPCFCVLLLDGARFLGEDLIHNCSFWWFETSPRGAIANLSVLSLDGVMRRNYGDAAWAGAGFEEQTTNRG